MPQQIDPQVKALVSSIGEAETGVTSPEAYKKRGASGEYGRYQFMPDTWKAYAKEAGVTSALEQSTIEDQNKVAYHKISQWKAQGYSPAQIASMWNAGPGKPNAYKENYKGVNSQGVAYDTPAYAHKVSQYYQQKKGMIPGTDVPAPQLAAKGDDSFLGDVGHTLTDAGTGVSNALTKTLSGEINPLSGLIQGAGSIAGGIGGLTTNVLEHTPIVGSVFKGIEGLIGSGVNWAANTDAGKGLITNYQKWAQELPEAAGNVGAAFDIATAIPILKGLGVAKNAAKGGISKVLHGATDDVLEAVSPALTPKQTAQALMTRGTVQKGLLRETQLAPDKRMVEVADAVKKFVPRFNPTKPALKNLAEIQAVSKKMAAELKAEVKEKGANMIYPNKQLLSRLRSLEKPDLIAADTTLNNVYDRLVKRVADIAAKKGGKVENLLDLRQEFDAIVKRQYPNLYRSESLSPLRQAVGDIRDEITKFTAEQLPKGFGLEDKLWNQHLLIKAAESLAGKASKGATKEIGTTALSRFGQRHPVIKGLVKTGSKAAIEGTGIGTVMGLMK